jgi:hypothetical protein
MFISVKRHEREKQELIGANNRFTDAVLRHASQGLFLLDSKDTVLLPVSHTLTLQFRRQDFSNLTFEKLLAPLVTAKTLTVVRNHIAALLKGDEQSPETTNPLSDVPVRLPATEGSPETAHYRFDFDPVALPDEPRAWLVRVTDITSEVTAARELEELRAQVELQGEMLRGVLQMGGARFGAFMQKTDAAMKTIGTVLKKPAREQTAFRLKLEETLNEVDRVRREAAAFKLSGLERTARVFEDALQDLRSRTELSGSDFLPLAVKLDHLYEQFASLKSLTIAAGPAREPAAAANAPPVTETGTQIISAPKFTPDMLEPKTRAAPIGRRAPGASTARCRRSPITWRSNRTNKSYSNAADLKIFRRATRRPSRISPFSSFAMQSCTASKHRRNEPPRTRPCAARCVWISNRGARPSICCSRTTAGDSIPTKSAPSPWSAAW